MLPTRREAKRLAQPPPIRWVGRLRAAARSSIGPRRLAILGLAGGLLAAMLVTAVRLGDPAGVVAIVMFAFLVVVAVNPADLRRRLPGFSGRSAWPLGLTLAGYMIIAGVVYGAVAQWLPAGPTRSGDGAARQEEAASQGTADGRPQVTVTSPAEPSFEATIIRVTAPNRLVIDGNELVELEGVPTVASDDPALARVVAALTDLAAGKVATVEVSNPGPPVAGTVHVWMARVTVSGPGGEGPVILNESALRALAPKPGATPKPGAKSLPRQ